MATLINGSLDDTPVPVSDVAKRSNNPIRRILESLKRPELPDKPFIALSLGDVSIRTNNDEVLHDRTDLHCSPCTALYTALRVW